MDYGLFEEALVDFFCRQHYDVAVARSRAAAIIRIAQGCDEEIVGGDRGMEIVCPTTIPFAEYIEAAPPSRPSTLFWRNGGRRRSRRSGRHTRSACRLAAGGSWKSARSARSGAGRRLGRRSAGSRSRTGRYRRRRLRSTRVAQWQSN